VSSVNVPVPPPVGTVTVYTPGETENVQVTGAQEALPCVGHELSSAHT
jgi:hypothetical protein